MGEDLFERGERRREGVEGTSCAGVEGGREVERDDDDNGVDGIVVEEEVEEEERGVEGGITKGVRAGVERGLEEMEGVEGIGVEGESLREGVEREEFN